MISEVIQKSIRIKISLFLLFGLSLSSCALFQNSDKGLSEQDYLSFTEYFHQAGIQRMMGNTDESLLLYEKAAEINPHSAAAHYFSALLYYHNQQYDRALYHVKQSVKEKPTHLWYNFLLASVYERKNDYKKSEKVYLSLLNNHPQAEFLYKDLIDLYLKFEESDKAVKTYKNYMRYKLPDEEYGLLVYRSLRTQAQKALDFAYYMRSQFNDTVRYDMLAAENYFAMNRIDKAEEIYMRYYHSHNSRPELLITLYNYFYYTEHTELTLSIEQRIIESDADFKTKLEIAEVQKQNDTDQYRKTLMSLAQQYPENPLIMAEAASFFYEQNKFEKAYKGFKIAFRQTKTDYELNLKLLQSAGKTEYFDEMEAFADTMLLYMPNRPRFYYYGALAAIRNHRPVKADQWLTDGELLLIDDDIALLNCFLYARGALAFLQHDYLKAEGYFRVLSDSDNFEYTALVMKMLTDQLLGKDTNGQSDRLEFIKPHLSLQFYHRAYALNLVNTGQSELAVLYLRNLGNYISPYTKRCRELLELNPDTVFLP